MFFISKPTIERKIADAFGYEYCTLFESGRAAIRTWREKVWWPGGLPSNVCPELRIVTGYRWREVAVHPLRGLAGVGVSLYGYQDFFSYSEYHIDPLMTSYLRRWPADETVISFGRKKMLDIGYGGALLSNGRFKGRAFFNPQYRQRLEWKFEDLAGDIAVGRRLIDLWDAHLGDSCVRIPQEQIMPWRVMRRIPDKRDEVVKAIRAAGYPVGTNYPPLPGVTNPGAVQWGKEVINFFPGSDAKAISEIVKRTLAQ